MHLRSRAITHTHHTHTHTHTHKAHKHTHTNHERKDIREKHGAKLRAALPDTVEVRISPAREGKKRSPRLHACDRDATQLAAQLAPWGTHHLRTRLHALWGIEVDPGCEDHRAIVMRKLLACYAAEPPRAVRRVLGTAVPDGRQRELLKLLSAWASAQEAGVAVDGQV